MVCGRVGTGQPPDADGRGELAQDIERLETICVKREPILLGEPDLRARYVDLGEHVKVERSISKVLLGHNPWRRAGV
jgi:hypothetical protein